MLRLDAADAATFDDVAVAEAERFAAADAVLVLRTKLLSMLAYMFECRARFEDIAASTAVAHQTNEAIAKEVARCTSKSSVMTRSEIETVGRGRAVITDDGRPTDSTHSTPACTSRSTYMYCIV